MIRSDKNFVRAQIAASPYAGKLEAVLIKSLIDALDRYEIENEDNDKIEQWVADAVSLFRGQPIVVQDERQWEDFLLGDVTVRDIVRVKPDAYTGEAGRRHNGRVGRVVGGARYKLSVVYEDKTKPPVEAVLHEFTLLQKLVK